MFGQRGAVRLAYYTGATTHASKWVPGTLTHAEPSWLMIQWQIL